MKGKRMFEAMGYIDDRYLNLADDFRKESKEMQTNHCVKRRSLMGLLAAAICVSLLAATAAAAGWIPGIFRDLQEKHPEDAALFEAAAQANTEVTPEAADIPQLDMSKFVLLEKYYDGETILLGYNLDLILPEPVVGIQPDKELMRNIKKGMDLSRVGWEKPKDWIDQPVTENTKKYHLSEDTFIMEQMMKATLSDDEYKKAWQLLKDQGWVCVATRDVYLGDHVLVNGHDIFEAYDPEDNAYAGRTEYETEYGTCLRLEPLPEAGRNQDSVTVTLKLGSGVRYWYMDLEGNGWTYGVSEAVEQVSFEVERKDAQ